MDKKKIVLKMDLTKDTPREMESPAEGDLEEGGKDDWVIVK